MLAMMAGLPEDTTEDFLSWLKRHGQTDKAIERFWKVVLVSALNEDLDRTSVRYAVQVFRESFLKSAEAGKMGVPRVPLSDLYGHAVDYIRTRGGEVLLRLSVTAISPEENAVRVSSYIELVISASNTLVEKSRQEVLDLAMKELAEFFPGVKEAKLLKATVIKEIYATYSVQPGLDQYRPDTTTEWPRLFLSGDWIAT